MDKSFDKLEPSWLPSADPVPIMDREKSMEKGEPEIIFSALYTLRIGLPEHQVQTAARPADDAHGSRPVLAVYLRVGGAKHPSISWTWDCTRGPLWFMTAQNLWVFFLRLKAPSLITFLREYIPPSLQPCILHKFQKHSILPTGHVMTQDRTIDISVCLDHLS